MLITWWEHSTLLLSVQARQTLVVDVSFKYRYDKLTRVAMMVIVRLSPNPEVVMDLWVVLPGFLTHSLMAN